MKREKNTEEKLQELKFVVRNYSRMDHKTRKTLQQLGFQIYDEDRHYKVILPGSSVITIIGKTPSCSRSGQNTFRYCKQQMKQAAM